MTLPSPRLDDRHFQDIVDEAKKRIPHFCREWTDHNVSDPGVTLIELFAWMTDMVLYRLNQVPDRHYIKFMEMFGMTLSAPVPAHVPVTFWLSAPQPTSVIIPANTEIATTQTETEAPVLFSTENALQISPPQLQTLFSHVLEQGSGQRRFTEERSLLHLNSGLQEYRIFSEVPQVDDALYFGFENDLSHHILDFELHFDRADAAGIDPAMPPYLWEAATGDERERWQKCAVESDTTKGMNSVGRIRIHLPELEKQRINGKELFWVRVRIKAISHEEERMGMRPYRQTPRLRRAGVTSMGGTVAAIHARQVVGEYVGHSDGTPGQRFQLQATPLLVRQPDEHLLVVAEGVPPQRWHEVTDFASSGNGDPHYTLNSVTGELRLGPALRQPDGTIKLYGAVPPRGAKLVFARYRYGGGQEGNVQAHVVNTLKTSIPFVAHVENRAPGRGGLDAESLDAAMMRAPALLRSRDRAVTTEDFEFLARQCLPAAIGRVKCLQPRPSEAGRVAPGDVHLLVIPRVAQPEAYLTAEELALDERMVNQLRAYLDERRLLTTRVNVSAPVYQRVSIVVEVREAPGARRDVVKADIERNLYRFLNPLAGGADLNGWPFGRHLFVADVYQALQGIAGVHYVRNVKIYPVHESGEAAGEPLDVVELVAHGVIVSGRHQVVFVEGESSRSGR